MRGAALIAFALAAGCASGSPRPTLPPEATAYLSGLKARLFKVWVPLVEAAALRNDPLGELYSCEDRKVIVEFELDRAGNLRSVPPAAIERCRLHRRGGSAGIRGVGLAADSAGAVLYGGRRHEALSVLLHASGGPADEAEVPMRFDASSAALIPDRDQGCWASRSWSPPVG